jgi:soluble lytic murein transglycosylase-like protein
LFFLPAAVLGKGDSIYSFKDKEGTDNLTNLPYLDSRYKLELPGKGAPLVPIPRVVPAAQIRKFSPLIEEAARSTGVDAKLLHAVIRVESGYNPNALSVKGARGLMQLMPMTGKRYGVTDPNDVSQNIHGGARYLRDLLAMFKNNLELALAGYNAGENAVIRAGHRVPNYPETRDYVPKVLSHYRSKQ